MVTLSKPPLLSGTNEQEKRLHIKRYFIETWDLYESLFSLINNDDAYYLRPEPLRHPLIFYFGHTAVFYVNKLVLGKFIPNRVNPKLESSCAVGVDEMSWDDLKPDNYQWPSVNEVRQYREQVKTLVLNLIESMPLTLPIAQDSLAWLILMGCEHERIHIETSSVIMRMMDLEYLQSSPDWESCSITGDAPENKLIAVEGKSVTLGKPETNDTYGWDNEYGVQTSIVNDFKASQFLVSNQEYMSFVDGGGYQNHSYWDEEGQAWLDFTKATMPKFWTQIDGEYWQRNLLEVVRLPLDWPVEVNYLEAKAFCNWKNEKSDSYVRMPTEEEWQRMRDQITTDLPYWDKAPGNINLEHYASSCPVNMYQQSEFYDVIGNVWQWTESHIDGFEGFKVHPLYDDFSAPTFDGRHNLIKGGSWISTGNEATRDSRYAFRRHFFQHAGFRYIESDVKEVPIRPVSMIEHQPEIAQQLFHHYSEKTLGDGHDLNKLVQIIRSIDCKQGRVLDLGCGVGRLSFELCKFFEFVDGIDFTARHIQHCLALKESGQIRFAMPTEGELVSYHEANLADLNIHTMPTNLNFIQGDAHNLKAQFNDYDLIVAHQLLDKLYDPTLFLQKIQERLATGGYLILSSSFQWDEKFTPKDKWLGGFKQDGENVDSKTQLLNVLNPVLTLIIEEECHVEQKQNSRQHISLCNEVLVLKKL